MIIDKTSEEICQFLTHKAIKIIENSLICATVSHAINHVLASYHIFHIRISTIRGFPIKIKSDKIIILRKCCMWAINHIWEPKTMKKMTRKKSLKIFIFAVISNLIGEKERVIPATSAQISIENPK